MIKLEYFPPALADSQLDNVLKQRTDRLTDITEYIDFFCEIDQQSSKDGLGAHSFAFLLSLPFYSLSWGCSVSKDDMTYASTTDWTQREVGESSCLCRARHSRDLENWKTMTLSSRNAFGLKKYYFFIKMRFIWTCHGFTMALLKLIHILNIF